MSENIRPTVAEINLANLRHNFRVIKDHVGDTKVMCVLKADAYGHGMLEYARVLSDMGVDYFGVAIVEEGIELREAGFTEPILVLGAILSDQIPLFLEHDLTLTAPSDIKLLEIDAEARQQNKRARVHLKIDTGMGRIGVNWQRAKKFSDAFKKCSHINLEGIYTHFAQSDCNKAYTEMQFERFNKAVTELEEGGLSFEIKHVANSGAICRHSEMNLDMVRTGILLHGSFASDDEVYRLPTKPVLTWKTRVIFFKVLFPGEYVSYGSTWTPPEEMVRIATLPLGYADGYGRVLDKKTEVLIHGKRYPIVGKVCMDQCLVDLGPDGEAYVGDEVVLIGQQGDQQITVEELAGHMNTVSYDVFCKIGKRVPRVYIG